VVAALHHFGEEQDLDPYPHQFEKRDPDPHQCFESTKGPPRTQAPAVTLLLKIKLHQVFINLSIYSLFNP
jgi:hypothetical protein